MCGTILLASAVLMAAGLAGTVPATAQSISEVQNALFALRPIVQQLGTAESNLLQMQRAMQGTPQFDAIGGVTSEKMELDGTMGEVFKTGRILANMKCPVDVQFVRDEFRESARNFVKMADISLQA